MEKIKFKQAIVNDWKLVEKLEKGAESPFFCPCDGEAGYKKYIKESKVFFIISGKKTIGTVSYKIEKNKTVLVNGLTILPSYRGKGFATAVMEKLLKTLGKRDFSLLVHPENIPALLIYLRLGFAISEWKDNYFGNGQPRLYLKKKIK
ncbi:MAG: GNAT family N-acetyltransferase [Candidatus Gracilibacteria bacterium]|jgi:ribosomal protein S18 acetylase RimI-like enzyme